MKLSFLIIFFLFFSGASLCQSLTPKENNGLYGIFSNDSMVLDFQYDTIHPNLDGFYAVSKEGKWGVINSSGKEIIACEYERMHLYRSGLYAVSRNGLMGVLDTTGAVVLDFLYDVIDHIMADTQILLKYQGKWCLYKNGLYNYNAEDFLFYYPDIDASLPGCSLDTTHPMEHVLCSHEKFIEFINRNISYPKIARRKGIEGQVIVNFTISREGKVQKPLIVKSIGKECDAEVLRVINIMPDWAPGMVDGLPVNTRRSYPISFVLTD